MAENSVISVAYGADRKIFGGVVLSALSLCAKTSRPLKFHIVTMDISDVDDKFKPVTDGQIKALDEVVKEFNPESSAVKCDVSDAFRRELINSKNLKNNFTPFAMVRLLLDYCNVPSKILYLDVDTMCCGDIAQLFDMDISAYEFAAALDRVGHIWVRPRYCNSGVMLMNMERIRETSLLVRARKYVNNRKLFMPDQSALNFLVKRKLVIPRRFNEQRKIANDTVVKHFCQYFKWYGPFFRLKNVKQWEVEKVHNILGIHDFDDIYGIYDRLDKKYNFKEL